MTDLAPCPECSSPDRYVTEDGEWRCPECNLITAPSDPVELRRTGPTVGTYVEERLPDGADHAPRRGYVIGYSRGDAGPEVRLVRWVRAAGNITAHLSTVALEDMNPATGDPPDRRSLGLLMREICGYLGQAYAMARRPSAAWPAADRAWLLVLRELEARLRRLEELETGSDHAARAPLIGRLTEELEKARTAESLSHPPGTLGTPNTRSDQEKPE